MDRIRQKAQSLLEKLHNKYGVQSKHHIHVVLATIGKKVGVDLCLCLDCIENCMHALCCEKCVNTFMWDTLRVGSTVSLHWKHNKINMLSLDVLIQDQQDRSRYKNTHQTEKFKVVFIFGLSTQRRC